MTFENNMVFETKMDVVYVSLFGKDREKYKIKEDHALFVRKFEEWLWQEKIWPFKTIVSGGGRWEGYFSLSDWPQIKNWLIENGASEGEI